MLLLLYNEKTNWIQNQQKILKTQSQGDSPPKNRSPEHKGMLTLLHKILDM